MNITEFNAQYADTLYSIEVQGEKIHLAYDDYFAGIKRSKSKIITNDITGFVIPDEWIKIANTKHVLVYQPHDTSIFPELYDISTRAKLEKTALELLSDTDLNPTLYMEDEKPENLKFDQEFVNTIQDKDLQQLAQKKLNHHISQLKQYNTDHEILANTKQAIDKKDGKLACTILSKIALHLGEAPYIRFDTLD